MVGSPDVSGMGESPWGVVSLSRHSPIVVRGFCFVKYGAVGCLVSDAGGEIPAFAGMTWEGAGVAGGTKNGRGLVGDMTWEGAGMTEAGCENDVGGGGNDGGRGVDPRQCIEWNQQV